MALELPAARHNGGVCTLKRIFAAAGPEDRKQIEAWLADPNVQAVQIARGISGKFADIAVTGNTVSRHRNGECACGR